MIMKLLDLIFIKERGIYFLIILLIDLRLVLFINLNYQLNLFYALGTLEQIDFNLSNKFIKREAYVRALNSMNEFYLKQYMINLEDGIMNFHNPYDNLYLI